MLYAQIHLTLPAWVHEHVDSDRHYPTDDDKVALAIDLARRNVDAGSGGPFGAAVFGPDHRIISVGVNRVLPQSCSLAHAETMAYMLAQQRTQRPRLNELEPGVGADQQRRRGIADRVRRGAAAGRLDRRTATPRDRGGPRPAARAGLRRAA